LDIGGTLVTQGQISVGDLTSLLLYTVYVGTGLQMLTCVYLLHGHCLIFKDNKFPGLSLYVLHLSTALSIAFTQTYFQSSIMRGIGAGIRIFDLLDRTPIIRPDTGIEVDNSRRGIVRFEDVTFEYPSRKGAEILKNFNLEIGVGESVAIVYVVASFFLLMDHLHDVRRGKSGGGKSSVHSLLLRYYDPVEGRITFDGQGLLFSQCTNLQPHNL
jgi:putative ABC transport system ATP-binding protein